MLERVWEGRIAVLIASGPSLTYEQCHYVARNHRRQGLIVAGCNDAYRAYRGLDLLYAADNKWWDVHEEEIQGLDIPEMLMPNETYSAKHGLTYVKGRGGAILSTDPSAINYASNSGFQLFNIAFLRGAKKIVLLGYDYGHKEKAHFFGNHPQPLRNPPNKMESWAKAYPASLDILAKADVQVINCSPRSTLTCFPKMPVEQALEVG